MLIITIPDERECWDESSNIFVTVRPQELYLEHSLVSISKWEAAHHKPFLSSTDKTDDEIIDYIRCMSLNSKIDKNVFICLNKDELKRINSYIQDSMTATTFLYDRSSSASRSRRKETITSELIYYWMIQYGIPFECQKWHLNRLLTLIQICNIKDNQSSKMSKNQTVASNRALNYARRKRLGTKG